MFGGISGFNLLEVNSTFFKCPGCVQIKIVNNHTPKMTTYV